MAVSRGAIRHQTLIISTRIVDIIFLSGWMFFPQSAVLILIYSTGQKQFPTQSICRLKPAKYPFRQHNSDWASGQPYQKYHYLVT